MKNRLIILSVLLFTTILSVSLILIFRPNKIELNFDADNETEIQSIFVRNKVIFPEEPTKEGHTFLGWYLDNNYKNEFNEYTNLRGLKKDKITVYAKWGAKSHIVTFKDHDDTTLRNEVVAHGMSATPPKEPTRKGYTFTGWNQELLEVKSDLIIKALYTANDYTVNFDSDGGDVIDNLTVEYLTEITLPIPTKPHYLFLGWNDGEKSYEGNYQVTEDIVLVARWILKEFTLSFDSEGSDTIDSKIITAQDTIETLPTLTKTDYVFMGWYYDEELIEAPFTYDFDKDITLVASWQGLPEGVTYEIVDNEAHIISYVGTETHFILPDTIEGYPITIIKDSAFKDNTTIIDIKLGQYIKLIDALAFSELTNLETIIIPNSVIIIGNEAFYNTGNLETVTFEENSQLTSIGDHAFSGTISLGSISIPKTVTVIGDSAFSGAINLESIVIPNSVTSIGESAFSGARNLQTVTFEENSQLTNIHKYAFRNANSIESIKIPNSVTSIGDFAFQGANNLKTVTFEENSQLEKIGFSFRAATGLESIVIPNSVTSIGDYAFAGSYSLKTIIFEANSQLTTIGFRAFLNTTSLRSIVIPNSVTSLGVNAFENANNLKTVIFEENSSLTTIGASAFSKASSLESIVIPNSVETIGSFAFRNANNLTIKAKSASKPSGWHIDWNSSNRPVVWGYTE